MKTKEDLRRILKRIDKRGYKAYKDIKGVYDFDAYTLYVDHIQSDPFAPPSRVRVRVLQKLAGFPTDTYHNKIREIGLRNFLTMQFFEASKTHCKGRRGTGKSGIISIDRPGQEILERTSVFVNDDFVGARFVMGLPAFKRAVAGKDAEDMFFDELPKIVRGALFFKSINKRVLYKHIEIAEDADFLRNQLAELDVIAFVADDAILPRASGVDDRPLTKGTVVPFEAPESMRIKVELPNRGLLTGLGIPSGVTLIVGGGYHGKSTLLRALELGVYNHIPGDGREYVVADPCTVKIRAEDGRRIEKVDISPFINNLPFGQNTRGFSSDDASGSTSQAANIIEAVEMGARVLLIDEDTSATNFMIRDHRMQELVLKDKEPITPFIDKVHQLYRDLGISTVLVMGGSGDYFDVADKVICMMEYKPHDVSKKAQAIADKYKAERKLEGGKYFGNVTYRIPLAHSFDPSKGKREVKISSKGLLSIAFGKHTIDLGAIEQLVDISQTRAIGDAIYYAMRYMDGRRTLKKIVHAVLEDIGQKGLDVLNSRLVGDYALFRGFELAAAINRLRTLSVKHEKI